MNSFALSKARDDIVRSDSFVESLNESSFAGYLDKLSTKGQWQKRFFTVHSHFLSYYKDREAYEENRPQIPAGSINLWHVSQIKLDSKKITLILSEKPFIKSQNQGVFPSPANLKYVSSSNSASASDKGNLISLLFNKSKNERVEYVLSASTEEEASRLIQAIQDCPTLTHLARDLASLNDSDQINQTSSQINSRKSLTLATSTAAPPSSTASNGTTTTASGYREPNQSTLSSISSHPHLLDSISILNRKGKLIHQFTNLSHLHLEEMKSMQFYLPESIDDPSKYQISVSLIPTNGENGSKKMITSLPHPISRLSGKSVSGDEIELLAEKVPVTIKWELADENSDSTITNSSTTSSPSNASSFLNSKRLVISAAVLCAVLTFGFMSMYFLCEEDSFTEKVKEVFQLNKNNGNIVLGKFSVISAVIMFLLFKHYQNVFATQGKSNDRYRITEIHIGTETSRTRAGSIAQENIKQNLVSPITPNVPDISITKEEYALIAKLRERVKDLYSSSGAKSKALVDIVNDWFGNDPIAEQYKQEKPELRKLVCDRHIGTDYRIVRFLRARKNNLDKAESMLRISIEWRIAVQAEKLLETYTPPDYLIEYCGCPDFYNLFFKEKNPDFINNFFLRDREGHLMAVARMGKLHWRKLFKAVHHDGNKLIKLGLWLLEFGRLHLDKLHEETNGKIPSYVTLMVDLSGFAISEQLPITTAIPLAKKFFFALSNSYPELLERIIVVNAPYLFASVWRIFQPFIPQEVQEKIIIHSDVNLKRDVIPHIAEDQIPAYLGGKYIGSDSDVFCLSRIPPYGPFTDDQGDSILARAQQDQSKST